VAAAATEYFVELAARCSPASIATMKRQVYQQLHAGLGPAEREAIDLMDEALAAEDFTEGVSAFVEHRAPVFKRLGDHSAANQA
jgi:enoyl-CoA hydratase/carnithine racemase